MIIIITRIKGMKPFFFLSFFSSCLSRHSSLPSFSSPFPLSIPSPSRPTAAAGTPDHQQTTVSSPQQHSRVFPPPRTTSSSLTTNDHSSGCFVSHQQVQQPQEVVPPPFSCSTPLQKPFIPSPISSSPCEQSLTQIKFVCVDI